jgi:hypothetical protein
VAASLVGLPTLVCIGVGCATYALANLVAPSPGMRMLLDLLAGGGSLPGRAG